MATVNDWDTCGAVAYALFPGWFALMVQVPLATKLNAPDEVTAHTAGVAELKATGRPELTVAVNMGEVPKTCEPGLLKVIVWPACGVTAFEAAESAPVPAELVAVKVKVYAIPFVSPVTVQGEAAQVPVRPPGADVAV